MPTVSDETFPLVFGVDSLDGLLSRARPDNAKPSTAPTSIAISGPDGSGKSILALHVASTYWCSAPDDKKPICLYVSTDLSFEQAERAWKAFSLNKPKTRIWTLKKNYGDAVEAIPPDDPELKLQLVEPVTHGAGTSAPASGATGAATTPAGATPTVEEMSLNELLIEAVNPHRVPAVYYIDLQKQSAGDDWQFLNRLLGILDTDDSRPNLLVIDAVEGLEVLVGRRDAFGEMRSRRSRIAQLIRTAKRKEHRAHLVFVIEEVQPNRRLPEQFVTDMVVRLRQRQAAEYLVRTIEIEKCRGYAHDRGEHQFVIRSGMGASTGRDPNVDEPEIRLTPGDGFLAHVMVLKSLHAWNAELRRLREAIPDSTSSAPKFFNLDLLGSLLGHRLRPGEVEAFPVPSGSITLLLGDSGTFKSRLARHFLLQAFAPPLTTISATSGVTDQILKKPQPGQPDSRIGKCYGVAVLLSTEMLDKHHLMKKLRRLADTAPQLVHLDEGLVLCRRLGVRYDSSAEFIAAIRSHIRKARQLLIEKFGDDLLDEVKQKLIGDKSKGPLHATHFERPLHEPEAQASEVARFRGMISARIRVVIDDLSLFLAAHPNIAADPLFLQSLMFLLKVEQVYAVIVTTQSGSPQATELDPNAIQLRHIDERHILLWNVPFFGEKRVAIAAMGTGTSTRTSTIFELRAKADRQGVDPEALEVDSHFLIYSGLEEGNPRRIPLSVRLFSGYPDTGHPDESVRRYPAVVKEAMEQVFASDGPHEVVQFEPVHSYDTYASFATWLDDSRLEQSLVFQIDEFWSPNEHGSQLMDLTHYWNDLLHCGDVYNEFLPHPQEIAHAFTYKPTLDAANLPSFAKITTIPGYPSTPELSRRKSFFFKDSVVKIGGSPAPDRVDRIPYLWDFGFLLAARDSWYEARNLPLDTTAAAVRDTGRATAGWTVGDVWDRLCLTDDRFDDSSGGAPLHGAVNWQDFFNACHVVARRTNTLPFHVDMAVGESVLSLLLELWCSIDAEAAKSASDVGAEELAAEPDSRSATIAEARGRGEVGAAATSVVSPHEAEPGATSKDAPLAPPQHAHSDAAGQNAQLDPAAQHNVAPATTDAPTESADDDNSANPGTASDTSEASKQQGPAIKPWYVEAEAFAAKSSDERISARTLVETQCPSLYIAMLELLSVCGHFESHRRALRVRDGVDVSSAVAERHWYSTASVTMERSKRRLSVLRLPGEVSTRGDWHLAVAAGSRSELVAHRALDILSSRPLALNRLAAGVGLPVRDVLSDRHIGEVLTALRRKDKKTARLDGISYKQLLEAAPGGPSQLAPFRRGWLREYFKDSTYLQRWLARMFEVKHLWSMPAVASIDIRSALQFALEAALTKMRTNAGAGAAPMRFDEANARLVNTEFESLFNTCSEDDKVVAKVVESYDSFKKLACILIDVLGPTGPRPARRIGTNLPPGKSGQTEQSASDP